MYVLEKNNSMNMRLYFTLLLLSLTFKSYAQDPWPSGKGKGYAQLLYTTIPTYSDLFTGNGTTTTTERELSDKTISAFANYGISDKLTIFDNSFHFS